jgi:hypothetical protein
MYLLQDDTWCHFFVSLFSPFSNAFEVASLLGTSGYGCCFNRRREELHGVNAGHDGGLWTQLGESSKPKNLPNPVRTEAIGVETWRIVTSLRVALMQLICF